MATLDELVVRLRGDSKDLEAKLDRADRSTSRFAQRSQRNLQKVNRAFQGLGAAIATLGIAAAGRQMVGFTGRALATANQLRDTADKLGLTSEALQELRFAAEQTGVASNTLDMAIQRFTRRLGEAQAGVGELKPILDEYNISVRNADGSMRAATDVLSQLADVISNAESDTERLRIAFKAFDSEGAALVNTLRGGSAELADMRREARTMGAVMSEDLVQAAAEFNTEMTALGRVIRTSFEAGILTEFKEAMVLDDGNKEFLSEISNLFGRLTGNTLGGILSGLKAIRETAKPLRDTLFGGGFLGGGEEGLATGEPAQQPDIEQDPTVQRQRKITEAQRQEAANRLQATLQAFMSEAEVEATEFERRQESLRAALEARLITQQEFDELTLENKRRLEEELTNITKDAEQERLDAIRRGALERLDLESLTMKEKAQIVSSKLQEIIGVTASSNKVLFQLNKAAALAEAALSAKETVVDAYAYGTKLGGPPLGAAFAAVAAASQAANIAAIAGSSFGGGQSVGAAGGGGGSLASGALATQEVDTFGRPTQQTQQINITLQGDDDELISTRAVRKLITRITEAVNDGSGQDLKVALS